MQLKSFIKKSILFAGFTALICFSVQLLILYRINGKTIRGHDNLEQTANIDADLVFLGSSRCWAHFDPQFFNSTFKLKSVNIGVDGHSELSMAIARLRDYLSRNKAPKFAILNFDPLAYSGSEKNNTNFIHKNDFARYSFFPSAKDSIIVNYFKFNFAEKYVPLYSIFKYQLLGNCIFLKTTSNYVRYGYEMHNGRWDTIASPVSAILKKSFFKEKDMSSITASLNRLKKMCLNKNIKLLCIQTPVYKVLYDEKEFGLTKKICSSVNIPFIDCNEQSITDNIFYFYNSNHLNSKGVGAMNKFLKSNQTLLAFLNRRPEH